MENWYLQQIMEEITNQDLAEPSNLYQELESLDLDKTYLIQADNSYLRRLIHIWADKKGLQHITCTYDQFKESIFFKCKKCHTFCHYDAMKWREDWSTLEPGKSYEQIAKCNGCAMVDDFNIIHSKDYNPITKKWNCKNFKVITGYNAILIGKSIPEDFCKEIKIEKRRALKKHALELDTEQMDNSILEKELNKFSNISIVPGSIEEFASYIRKIKRIA